MGVTGLPGDCSGMELPLELAVAVSSGWVSSGSSLKRGEFYTCSIRSVDAKHWGE